MLWLPQDNQNPRFERVTNDDELEMAALANPDTLFSIFPDWSSLNDTDEAAVVAEFVRWLLATQSSHPVHRPDHRRVTLIAEVQGDEWRGFWVAFGRLALITE